MARLSTQVAIIGFGRMLSMAAAAGTLMALARLLPDKVSYGAILQLIILYVTLSQIFAVGLPQAIYYFMPRYHDGEQRGFLTQIIVLLLGSGLLLGVGFFFGADAIGKLLNSPSLPPLLRIFALYPCCMLPTLAVEGALLIRNRPLTVVIFSTSVRLSMFCALVIPSWLHAPLTDAIKLWVALSLALCGVALCLLHGTVRHAPLVWHRPMLGELWRFSLPLALLTIVALCSSSLDRFLVSRMFGTAAFGAYSNATLEIPTVSMVTNATAIVLLAEFSRLTAAGDYSGVLATWHRASIKTGILIMASFGFLALWGHETMRLVFSDRFADSGTIFSIYAWSIPLMLFAMRPLYISCGATNVLTLLTLLDIVLGLGCMLGFGHLWGPTGIAFGAVLASALTMIPWVHVYVCRLTHIGWRAFMPWNTLVLICLVALGAGGATRVLLSVWLHPAWPLPLLYALAVIVYLALYTLALYATRLLHYVIPARFLPARSSPAQPVAAVTQNDKV
jgi:O-antigen/teichoic acid export membrane protein